MDAPVFTLHRYFETYRETEYKEFVVGEVAIPFPNELMNAPTSEAARLIVEDSSDLRYRPDNQDPTKTIGVRLIDETFSQRELANLRLISVDGPITVRVLVHHYRR